MSSLLLLDVELEGHRTDVRVADGAVAEVGALAPVRDEEVVTATGGALLPGLHDHHLHLLAMAADKQSVDVSRGLHVMRDLPGEGWVRAVRWGGDGDRSSVDAVMSHRPVRVQHRSGALWVLNSRACDEVGLENGPPGVERDGKGSPTGRVWREDAWLGARWGREEPDLAAVSREMAAVGLTGCTDATPDLDGGTRDLLRRRVWQRLLLLGDPDGPGPVKVVLADSGLPTWDELAARVEAIRPRAIAAHCVTRESLVLLWSVLQAVGRHPGDRVEHAAVVPAELRALLPAVITQPGFVAQRGDSYLRDVPGPDLPDLYRYRSLLEAGTCVVPSSDAPHGPLDPWLVLRAARDRTTAAGLVLGPEERVDAATALDGYLRPLEDVTAPRRQVRPGEPADLVLLHVPLRDALADPCADLVRRTVLSTDSSRASDRLRL